MANYKKLIIWQKADKLAHLVYKLTEFFPKHEIFGLTSQLRRAAISVPLNIVEGYNRTSKKELRRFIDISLGSLAEVEFLLEFSKDLDYHKIQTEELNLTLVETGKTLWSFRANIF